MNQTYFQFQNPEFLFFLFLLPLVFIFALRNKIKLSFRFSSIKLFKSLPLTFKQKFSFIPLILRIFGLALIIIALARPQFGNKITEVLDEGIDILLTIDTSGSMKALDFHLEGEETNRLDVVKSVVSDFVNQRKHDRIGMVIFGEDAYTQCPLTRDQNTIQTFLKWIRIGIVGDGTAIGNAIAASVKRLKDQTTKSKIIILLTDGRNNAGEIMPEMAAQIAKEFGIKIYTIGVGSNGPVPYPEETIFGVQKIYARLDLDEGTLKAIAEITGGQYFRATDTKELETIYDKIDELEKTEVRIKEYSEYKELFAEWIIWGLLFLVIEQFLKYTLFLRIP